MSGSATPAPSGNHAANATIPAGHLPAWEVAELPEPPLLSWNLRSLIGPGLMMAGAAIGGGEWLMGPVVTAKYGATFMWLALLSILFQVVYNLEVMRYALYCGEPIMCGFFRLTPGPKFWSAVYLFIDFFGLWPYLSASAAVPVAAALLGHLPGRPPTEYLSIPQVVSLTGLAESTVRAIADHPDRFGNGTDKRPYPAAMSAIMAREKRMTGWIGCGLFLIAFLPLIFGGRIYLVLERIMTAKIILVFAYLLFLGFFFVGWRTWCEIFGGLICLGPLGQDPDSPWGFRLFPADAQLDWAALGAFAAIAGNGGLTNLPFSSYVRDQGWGMGSLVGVMPSLVSGRDLALAHTGKVFHISAEALRKWHGWMKVLLRDQWAIWCGGCILGVTLPALISLQYLRNQSIDQSIVAAATAQALNAATGWSIFWGLTLACGFLVLFPNQISTIDGLVRRWTEVLWTGSGKLRALENWKVRFVYFGLLLAYLVWGLLLMLSIGEQPQVIIKVGGMLMNFALGFSALQTLACNVSLLPKALRPGWPARIALAVCAVYFIWLSWLSAPGAFGALRTALGAA